MSIFNKLFKKHPKDKAELKSLIEETVKKNGPFCDLNFIDVSQITDMSNLFEESDFNGDISKWDVSNVTTMKRMFRMSKFTGDISQWNVSNVTDMEGCFSQSEFKGDISRWNVSKVTSMSGMFKESKFNGNISTWDVSKVTDMNCMFYNSSFNGDVSKWNVSNVKNMAGMFGCLSYKCDLSDWDVSKVSSMSEMFGTWLNEPINCYIGDFSKWNVRNADDISFLFKMKAYSEEEMSGMKGRMFQKLINTTCPKNRDELKKILKLVEQFGINDLNFVDVSMVTDMSGLFEDSKFNGNISKWDVSKVTNMENMFHNSKFNGDISNWNVSNVVNMKGMFSNDEEVIFGDSEKNPFEGNLSNWDVSSVTNMESMFQHSSFNGDISKWNVSKVENMTAMFKNSKFHGDISGWTLAPKTADMLTNSGFSEEEINSMLCKLCKPFVDPRDGQTYKVCRIGGQIWMAENLRYRCKKGGSVAYDEDASNVPKYGRLYEWDVAKEACPPGWHLPSKEEYETMIKYVEKEYDVSDALRSVEWNDGIDAYGFSAVPAGIRIYDSDKRDKDYRLMGKIVEMWTSSLESDDCPYYFKIAAGMDVYFDGCGIGCYDKRNHYYSIRCIKD